MVSSDVEVGDRIVSINGVPPFDANSISSLVGRQYVYHPRTSLIETGARQKVGTVVRVRIEKLRTGEAKDYQFPLRLLQEDYVRDLMKEGIDCSPSALQSQSSLQSTPAAVIPQNLQSAWFVSTVPTGDFSINRCFYKTSRGYEFEVNHRGLCPSRVRINPETNLVYFD
jgi:hypothetical protein